MNFVRILITGSAVSLASAAQAQPIVVADSGDSAWMLSASVLVLIAALPGLALLRGRGNGAIALVLAAAITSLGFAILGYSLAFGEGSTILGGAGNALLANMADLRDGTTISESVFALFQLAVAIFGVGILVASIAERTRIGWLAGFVGLWGALVYVPLARWIWGGGWLAGLGALDYSGGLVVQTSAGTAALVIALLLGRSRTTDVAQESPFALGGLAFLWIGWFGVVGGAALAAGDDAAGALLNAQLAASAAVLTGLAIERWRTGSISASGTITAAIAGLAAISAGAGFVGPGGAIALGILGALAAWAAGGLVTRLSVGGVASAFAAHGGGGIVGALVFPLFVSASLGGPGFDEGTDLFTQLTAQGVAVLVVVLWTAVVTAVAALMVTMVAPMRAVD